MTLDEAIEALYVAFARHPRRKTIDACPHCVGTAQQDTLARVPLRQLSCEQLGRYAFKAMTTWGGPEDYKHFLPRILDLAVRPGSAGWPGFDLELIAGKLRLAGIASFSDGERTAVRRFFEAFWKTVLATDPLRGTWRAHHVLAAIALTVDDVSVILDAWDNDRSLASSLQLADFVDANVADFAKRGHLGRWWREVPDRDRIERWLRDPARGESLRRAAAGDVDATARARLDAAIEEWESMNVHTR